MKLLTNTGCAIALSLAGILGASPNNMKSVNQINSNIRIQKTIQDCDDDNIKGVKGATEDFSTNVSNKKKQTKKKQAKIKQATAKKETTNKEKKVSKSVAKESTNKANEVFKATAKKTESKVKEATEIKSDNSNKYLNANLANCDSPKEVIAELQKYYDDNQLVSDLKGNVNNFKELLKDKGLNVKLINEVCKELERGTNNPSKPSDNNSNPNKPSDDLNVKPNQPSDDLNVKPNQPSDNNQSNQSDYASEVLRLVNVERSKAGLSKLSSTSLLTEAANVRAKETVQSFSHTRPNGTSFSTVLKEYNIQYRTAGENIAYGQRTPQEVVTGWMNSSGHRANILNTNYNKLGVGVYKASNGLIYWSQLFTD